jgi:hypothetical protein
LREQRARGRGHSHAAGYIDIDHLREGVGLVLGLAADDARAIHDVIEPGQAREEGGNRLCIGDVEVPDIDAGESRVASRRVQLLRHDAARDHTRARAPEGEARRRSDTRHAAGDERDPAGEIK